MKFIFSFIVSIILLSSIQAQPTCWLTSGMERTGPSDPPRTAPSIVLTAAKGEYEPFQLVVRAAAAGLSNVNVVPSDLISPSGRVISRNNYELYREQYLNVTQSSYDYGKDNRPLGPGWYADGLIPFVHPVTRQDLTNASLDAVPFSLASGKNQPIWLDLFIPANAIADDYAGSVTVTSNQGSTTMSVRLIVRNFTLPLKPTLKSSFGIHPPYSSETSVNQLLLRHKIMPLFIKPQDGRMLIDNYGLTMAAVWVPNGSKASECHLDPPSSLTAISQQAARFPSDMTLYFYTADEIDRCSNTFDAVKAWARVAHTLGYENLVTVTPNPALYDDGSGTGRSAVDIWALLPGMYDSAPARVAEVLARGNKIWSYNTLEQDTYSPKWLMDFAPINYRVQPGFISQSLGITGMLYSRIDEWSGSPWTDPHNHVESGRIFPGESMLVYPGPPVGLSTLVPSMRLKWLREGVEDYEYVALLKQKGRGAWAIDMAKIVGKDWKNWTKDPNRLQELRTHLGQELDRLSGGAAIDVTPPIRASESAATASATGVTLSLQTVENATCRYSAAPGVPYSSMTGGFPSAGQSAHSADVTGLVSGTSYTYYVRCTDATGNVNKDDFPIAFTVGGTFGAPSAPTNPFPAQTATNIPISVTVNWTPSAGADSYDLYFGSTAGSIVFIGNVRTPGYNTGIMASGRTFYWKVVAKNSVGGTPSPVWSFSTYGGSGSPPAAPPLAAPAIPASPSPATGATSVPTATTLVWGASARATSYDLYGGTSPSTLSLILRTSANSQQVGLLANTGYYWKVVANNASGSASSAIWSFRTR